MGHNEVGISSTHLGMEPCLCYMTVHYCGVKLGSLGRCWTRLILSLTNNSNLYYSSTSNGIRIIDWVFFMRPPT